MKNKPQQLYKIVDWIAAAIVVIVVLLLFYAHGKQVYGHVRTVCKPNYPFSRQALTYKQLSSTSCTYFRQ